MQETSGNMTNGSSMISGRMLVDMGEATGVDGEKNGRQRTKGGEKAGRGKARARGKGGAGSKERGVKERGVMIMLCYQLSKFHVG
jgi:hypothetical protein